MMNTEIDTQALEQLTGKVVCDLAANYSGVLVSVGDKLGLYQTLAAAGPLDSEQLARRSDCNERYVREWLKRTSGRGLYLLSLFYAYLPTFTRAGSRLCRQGEPGLLPARMAGTRVNVV